MGSERIWNRGLSWKANCIGFSSMYCKAKGCKFKSQRRQKHIPGFYFSISIVHPSCIGVRRGFSFNKQRLDWLIHWLDSGWLTLFSQLAMNQVCWLFALIGERARQGGLAASLRWCKELFYCLTLTWYFSDISLMQRPYLKLGAGWSDIEDLCIAII